jgi:integrase
MGRSKTTGIYPSADGTYEVDAQYRKQRIRRCGFARYDDAEAFLIDEKAKIGMGTAPGHRPKVTLDFAAAHHLDSKVGMPSWDTDRSLLTPVIEMCGSLTLEEISDEALKPFVHKRRDEDGVMNSTINDALSIVQTICNRAATKWRHPNKMTWLEFAPKLTLLDESDSRPPRPISWAEQRAFLPVMPPHLEKMALFDLNTGLREDPLVHLSWHWEARVPLGDGLTVSVFVVPRQHVKGRKSERIVVCNSVAQSIVDSQRGLHPQRVFTYAKQPKEGSETKPKHKAVESMNNTAWQTAREKAGLGDLHVHDLRHTVGMRLRDAGVSPRTQDDILWHSRAGMTAHYAVAQIREIYEALELIKQPSAAGESINLLAVLRSVQMQQVPVESPHKKKAA